MTRSDARPEPDAATPWHGLSVDAALADLAASADGLSEAEARARVQRHGLNRVSRDPGPSAGAVLVRQLRSPLIYALMISAAVALALGELANGAVVLAVVVLNALIGFVQEYRAGRAIQALAALISDPATVRREGAWTQVPAEHLVPGDVVAVTAGDRVAADLRILTGQGLQSDESAMTGESVPVGKTDAPVLAEAALAERRSMLHAGTLVTAGRGRALVVATGDRTQLGRISGLMRSADEPQTPLTRAIAGLAAAITRSIAVVAVLLLGVALVRGYPTADAALAAITMAVAAIPEGLPAIVTIALAIGVQRMARRQAIVRELPAVETLGSTTVVCTDKTGTLTRNQMVLRRALTGTREEDHLDQPGSAPATESMRQLLVAAALANEARLEDQDGELRTLGDPTDGALLVAAERAGISLADLQERFPRRDLLPFDSERRYMASAHDGVTYLKGAPEVILARLDDVDAAWKAVERYAQAGLRVLAVAAAGERPVELALTSDDLRLVGLVALIDPPRTEAIEAVTACHEAGVDVKMITGDHAATAAAIGRELGIVGRRPPLTGAEVAALSDEALSERVKETAVFARVAPEHKLRLVRALQANGEVAAMTGDGVNDAPALRQADIGVAMGVGGTAAAKEAADIVLGDDNFATIRAAVEEGRRVYDNLVKALAFALPTNVGEALVILVAVLAFPIYDGDPLLPIEPVQILWINLVATVSLALPLAFEAMEPGIMLRPPRAPRAPLLSRFVIVRTVYVGVLMCTVAVALFLLAFDTPPRGRPPSAPEVAEAQTLAVTSLALLQVFYLVLCRTLTQPLRTIGLRSNPAVFAGIGTLLVLQAGFVHLPFMHELFGSASLSASQWLLAAAGGALVIPVVAGEKAWRARARSAVRGRARTTSRGERAERSIEHG